MRFRSLTPPVSVTFDHAATYSDLQSGPVVDIELAALDERGILSGTYTTGMVVDSGADLSLLSAEVAGRLGIDLSQARYPKGRARGIVPGQFFSTAEAPVLIRFGTRWLKAPVRFVTTPDPVRPLLGRRGVFDQVTFAFQAKPPTVLGAV